MDRSANAHTATATNATTIRIKIMVPPIDAPATVPIDPAFVVMGVACEEELLIVVDELVGLDIELVVDDIDFVLVEDLDEEAIVVTDELMLALSVKWY